MDHHRHIMSTAQRVVADAQHLCDAAANATQRARQAVWARQESWPEPAQLVPEVGEVPAPVAFRVEIDRASPPDATLHVHGELDLATGPRLNAALRDLLSDDSAALMRVDLAGVTFISVGAVRELLDAVCRARGRGLPVCIVNESPAVVGLLTILGRFDQPTTRSSGSRHRRPAGRRTRAE